MGLEQTVDRNLGDEITFRIRERHGQLPWRQLWLIQCQLNDLVSHNIGDAVPDPARTAIAIFEPPSPKL